MNKLRIHTLIHVPFEGLGCIENWIQQKGHIVIFTKLYEEIIYPTSEEYDWLIVMGGPMSVYDEDIFPWLTEEKKFIRSAIDSGKTVIGICLGSQFIADVLGAKVYPNKIKEIGWLEISKTNNHPLTENFTNKTTVFQWHGDTFDIPADADQLFESDVCKNQAFIYDNRVLALQFHFEATPASIHEMLVHGAAELIPAATIQTADEIKGNIKLTEENNRRMYEILDMLAGN